MNTTTTDMHRTLEKRLVYLTLNGHTKPLSESALECRLNFRSIMTEGCGQIDTTID